MRTATLVTVLGFFASAGCDASPSAPSPATPSAGGLVISGIVYVLEPSGRRPLSGATVEIAESEWGVYSRPTDALGRYTFASLPARNYRARVSLAGYDASAIMDLGFVDRSRTQDFELTPAGSTGPLTIEAVAPGTGATGGSATVKITGTGFQLGTTVTFGGARGSAWGFTGTSLWVLTPAHPTATVDVVISRPNGDTATLAGAYTFVAASAFDFNGSWEGEALAHPGLGVRSGPLHEDMQMRFTIQDNVLTSFSCGGSTIPALSAAPVVTNGEFALAPNGVEVSGRIVSTNGAVGTINSIACPATRWTAMKR